MDIAVFWFRRDLRLHDNIGLYEALNGDLPVLPVFIFDTDITDDLPKDDARISFIYKHLKAMNEELSEVKSGLKIYQAKPIDAFQKIFNEYTVKAVYTNRDYEPYAIKRDKTIKEFVDKKDAEFHDFKDQVIFEKDEVLKDDGDPYVVYTPYKNKWLEHFEDIDLMSRHPEKKMENYYEFKSDFPSMEKLGFEKSEIEVDDYDLSHLEEYDEVRDYPAADKTSYLSPHLRFGTVSVREILKIALEKNEVFVSELIWREFFMQILFHFPKVVDNNFRSKYDGIKWNRSKKDFEKWCKGETGYPMVDAGMRQLNKTGYMHNRVRMITAGFLCKHLLIDWKWGEAYFAKKLLDYELSSNNGNWQWAAGTGCDAAPYFRIFNPTTQIKKFDKDKKYIKKWIKEFDTDNYPEPMVNHKEARERALEAYKKGMAN